MASEIPREDQREYDVFLIGKTGVGKSATGNTILRKDAKIRNKIFKRASNAQSVTFDVQREWGFIDGHFVKVVDGPGLAENRMDPKKAEEKARKDMCHAMDMCGGGFHALALVLKFGDRFTAETKACLNLLRTFFGDDFMGNYGIIIMTNADSFENCMEDEDTPDKTFEEWCQTQGGELLDLFKQCNFRVVLFDNMTRSNDVLKKQRQKLFATIDSLEGKRYTNNAFREIERVRKEKIEETNALQFKEEVMKASRIIEQKLQEIISEFSEADENYRSTLKDLDQVEKQSLNLLKEISGSDRPNARVKQLIDEATRILEKVRSFREQVLRCQDAAMCQRQAKMEKESETKMQPKLLELERERNLLKSRKDDLAEVAKDFEKSRRKDVEEEQTTFVEKLGDVAWTAVKRIGSWIGGWFK